MRRNLINVVLTLVLLPSTVYVVLRMMPATPQTEIAFANPRHRVAVALDEVMQAELTSVTHAPANFMQSYIMTSPSGGPAVPGQYPLDEDQSVLWLTIGNAKSLSLWSLVSFSIEGKTRDGRTIKATIGHPSMGEGSLVDFHGDADAVRNFSGKISERLAHPRYKHDSPEDRAALMAFFQPLIGKTTSFAALVDPAVIQASIPPPLDLPGLDSKDAVR